jgi:TolB-like protein/DNA-binding winged helix-turn-helix (wHTH) protein/Flp pilus assembly protein TadD
MAMPLPAGRVRFGVFEVNLRSGELHKHSIKIKLHDQPFQILAMLLEHQGEVVTREQLRQKLWPTDTCVDFDVGLNSAVKKLRDALGDSAETPRFVETLPRRGYRFLAAVESMASASAQDLAVHTEDAASVPGGTLPMRHAAAQAPEAPGARRPAKLWIAAGAFAAILALFAGLNVAGLRQRFLRTSGAVRIQSIAVLPLENLSGDPAQEYFADGMTEALIIDLARISSLRVISRTSAMRYKGARKPLAEIARELNVDAVVEGSVVRSGNRVRINALLIQAAPEHHLWANAYERDLADVVALQGDMARAIATEIQIKLTSQEQVRLAGTRPVNPEAYEAYLKGRYHWNKRTKEEINKGIEFFEQAIQKDPSYAPAYTGLADCYNILGFGAARALPPREAGPKAKAAARKALELDDTLAEAHASLAFTEQRYDWDCAGSEKEFRRAIELNPGYALTYLWYSQLLRAVGRFEDAVAMARRAQKLDPISPNIQRNLAVQLLAAKQYEQALAEFQKALELDPNLFTTHSDLGLAYELMGRYKDAIAETRKAIQLTTNDIVDAAQLGCIYAFSGRKREAEKTLEDLKSLPGRSNVSYDLALIYAGLGRKGEAIAWLEKAYQERSGNMIYLKVDPWLDSLRSDPRFINLVRRVGLSPNSETRK